MKTEDNLKKQPTTIILEPHQLEWLRKEAYNQRISKSEIIRQLIEQSNQEKNG